MKFKKFLSLTLATTIAFTATLSSSASIFADDVEIPQTEESQSFGSLILEKIKSNYGDSNIDDSVATPINPNNGSEIAPMWNGATHDDIITDNNFGYIPEKYVDLVMKICRWCDDPTRISNSTCIHGNCNYVASLKFLWKYAKVIGNKNISGTYSQLSANAKNVALAQFNNKGIINNKADYQGLLDLATRTVAIINQYGKEKTPKERKYLIYGVILHLLGDITAHRTIVPQFMVNRVNDPNYKNSENKFETKHFGNNWSYVKSLVQNGNIDFTTLQRYSSGELSIKEFRKRYEDNTKVVPNRVLAAETMAEYFMRKFSGGFDVNIFDVHYANVTLINYINYRNQG